MRKIAISAFVLLLLAGGLAWTQNLGLTSLLSDFSFGVFWNELDVALNVGNLGIYAPQLSSDYLFAGLGNLNQSDNISTFTAGTGDPMYFGLYRQAKRPWSLFGGFYHADAPLEVGSDTTYTPSAPVVVGTETYYFNTQVVETDYRTPIYQDIEDAVQVIFDLGALNVGAVLGVYLEDVTDPANNYELTETNNYDSAPGGDPPEETLDWTRTEIVGDRSDGAGGPGVDNLILLDLPVYLKAMNAIANLRTGFGWWNASQTRSEEYTVPENAGTIPGFAAGTFTDTEQDDTLVKGISIPLELDFDLGLAPLWGGNPRNKFLLGAGAWTALYSMTVSDVLITQDYTFVPGGSATAAARNDDTDDYSFGLTASFGADATVAHSLYFEPAANVVVGFVPTLQVAYEYLPAGVKVSERTQVDRTDGDADGEFSSAADTVSTATTTYYDAMMSPAGVLGDASADNVIGIALALPSALKFQVADWFGITLGARPRLEADFTLAKTTGQTASSVTTVVDGTGAAVSETTVNAQTGDITRENSTNWTFAVDHNVGVQLGVPGGIVLYVDVSAAVTGGVWDFESLIVQGVIPLPAKK
jgi:hypothetical protein